MSKAAILALLCPSLWAVCPAGYGFFRPITIQHTKVSAFDQADFPVLVCFNGAAPCNGSFPELAAAANGGKIRNAITGAVPYSHTIPGDFLLVDSDGSTVLPFEIENYSPVTGELQAWVRKTLSHSADTVIYACLGNASVTTDQSNPHGVWDPHYAGVWHLANGSAADSTANANNGASSAVAPGAAQIDGGAVFMSSSHSAISLGMNGYSGGGNTATVEGWTKITGPGSSNVNLVFGYGSNAYNQMLAVAYDDSNNWLLWAGGGTAQAFAPADFAGWHYLAATITSGSSHALYVDGVPANSGANLYGDGWNVTLGSAGIGSVAAIPTNMDGSVDEVRISNTARSADWIATEYSNQSSPGSFYILGDLQQAGANGPTGGGFLILR